MEGIEIYEKSKKELDQLKKHLTNSGLITINFDNLDGPTKERMISAINGVITTRLRDINSTITGVNVI